jgi:hypothetical protein
MGKAQKTHACRVCGAAGHRADSCKSYAAGRIRDLQQQLVAKKVKKERPRAGRQQRPRTSGAYRAVARQRYTGRLKPKTVECRYKNRDHVLQERKDAMDYNLAEDALVKDGFLKKRLLCSRCGAKAKSLYRVPDGLRGRPGCIYDRCKKCKKYLHFLDGTRFQGLRVCL